MMGGILWAFRVGSKQGVGWPDGKENHHLNPLGTIAGLRVYSLLLP